MIRWKGLYVFSGREIRWPGRDCSDIIYSVARALELYILKADDETLYHGTLVADVHCYKNNFFEKILLKLGEEFITDTDVQNLAGVYGDNCLKVSEKELQYILFYIHNNALIRCLEEFKKNKFVPVEEAEKQIKLGAVITRLNSTIRRTKKYLDGSIPCLEELEETRLPYFEKNADKRENRWSQIISGSDLIDTI